MGEALDLPHKLFFPLSPLIPWKSLVLLMAHTGFASTLPAAGCQALPSLEHPGSTCLREGPSSLW